MSENSINNLETAIKDFVAYLDTVDFESGDTLCLHMSWYRSGNNRRKRMTENGSSFLKMDCSVAIKRPDVEQARKDGYLFKHFNVTDEDFVICVSECRKLTTEYIKKTYG